MSVKISVIMPVYNVEKYIEESLRSVCQQDFENFEVIIVNDGTKDHSIEVAYKVLNAYSIPYVVINKENGGLPSARNAGLKAAKGDYVCFIDSDDIISKSHLSDLWNCCKTNKVVASYAPFQLTYENNRFGDESTSYSITKIQHKELLRNFLIRKVRIHCCSLLVDRGFLINNNYFFNEKLRYGEDIDFMWRIFPAMDAIGCTGRDTYKYLQRSNSLMTTQNLDRVLLLMRIFDETVRDLVQKYPDDYDVFKYLYGKAALAFYRTFAESASFELFTELIDKSNYKKTIACLLGIGNFKISLLAGSLLLSPKAFVYVVKKNRETVEKK